MNKTFAIRFDGRGHYSSITLDRITHDPQPSAERQPHFIWVHINRGDDEANQWLNAMALDPLIKDTLTASETRPRCNFHQGGAILNLRGVNLNPGAEPEDMISLRFWVNTHLVITCCLRPLIAIEGMVDSCERTTAPTTPGALIAGLALRLADSAEPTISQLNERIDALEEQILDDTITIDRGQLAAIRRSAIVLRRYLFPQRDALTTLEIEELTWMRSHDISRIREAVERVTRLGEELDAIRDRAQIVHDQIMDKRAEMMNRQMLVLSVVAALFLPLGLLTGLFGVNVGGIPLAQNDWGFFILSAILVALSGFLVWLFRKIGMI